MPTTKRRRARVAAGIAVSSLMLLTGCSGGNSGAPAAESAPVVRDLAGYDVFVLANAENNRLFADVYGIRFTPFGIERITTNKRISSLGADRTHVMVAAADENIDQLARVTATGELEPIPGLGRPFAYGPQIVDGVMYFDDSQGDPATGKNRFYAWDLDSQTRKLLFATNSEYGGVSPIGKGRLSLGVSKGNELLIREKSGATRKLQIGGPTSSGGTSGSLAAFTLVGANSDFGTSPEALVLLNLDTGRRKSLIRGLQFIAWSPDGTRILARRTGNLTESRLVILDPAKPDVLMELATVPGLVIFGGVWVRGSAPPA